MTVSITWTDANGATTELVDPANGISVLRHPLGFDAPPVELTEEGAINNDGSVLLSRRYPPRLLAIPLLLQSARARDLSGQLVRSFAGPGQLTWWDGTVYRTLRKVYYSGGLEGIEIVNATESTLTTATLRALDPWWYGAEETYALSVAATVAFDAVVAFDDASTLFDGGDVTPFVVSGDGPVFPVFTITGAFTSLTVGIPGGEEWQLAAALASGDVITIDTRPGSRGPSLNGGAIDWSLLSAESRLFSLAPSLATYIVTAAAGTDGTSEVLMSFEPRHLSL